MNMDGKSLGEKIREDIKKQVDDMKKKPSITVVLVGEDPASSVYVNMKDVSCKKAGITSEQIRLPEKTTEEELLDVIDKLNKNDSVDAILVQLPLPKHISDSTIIKRINPEKDVDGLHPVNLGLLQLNKGTLVPCTPKGIIRLLEEYKVDIEGKHAVVVGRSNIVGKPVANLLLNKNATVTICHSRTKDLSYHTKQADILVVSVGKPELITGDMVKEGAVVIDVGVNRVDDSSKERGYRLVGDVKYDEVEKKASMITPVPGGVGPMTIAMLMENTVETTK